MSHFYLCQPLVLVKGWTKNSINGEVEKVWNSRHINEAVWRTIFVMQFTTNIN